LRSFVIGVVLAVLLLSYSQVNAVTLTPLRATSDDEYDPCFSPDGQHIVFCWNNSAQSSLALMSASGGNPITLWSGYHAKWPTWSPGGSTIVFAEEQLGEMISDALKSIPSTGGSASELTPPFGRVIRHPCWSPTGADIFFSAYSVPSWSPTGADILFSLYSDLWTVPASGGTPSRLWGVTPYTEYDPSISPDGHRIAYASNVTGGFQIYVRFLAGDTPIRLTTAGGPNLEPAWSPDGTWIAFAHIDAGDGGIWVIPATGGVPVCITCSGFLDGTPNWSPDGRSIVFDRYSGSDFPTGNQTDLWIAADLNLGPTSVTETTWGRIKAMFR